MFWYLVRMNNRHRTTSPSRGKNKTGSVCFFCTVASEQDTFPSQTHLIYLTKNALGNGPTSNCGHKGNKSFRQPKIHFPCQNNKIIRQWKTERRSKGLSEQDKPTVVMAYSAVEEEMNGLPVTHWNGEKKITQEFARRKWLSQYLGKKSTAPEHQRIQPTKSMSASMQRLHVHWCSCAMMETEKHIISTVVWFHCFSRKKRSQESHTDHDKSTTDHSPSLPPSLNFRRRTPTKDKCNVDIRHNSVKRLTKNIPD